MRISDWSSDVCSSDLRPVRPSTALHGKSTNGPGRKPSPSPPIPSSRVRMHAQPDIRSAGDLVYSRAPAAPPSSQNLVRPTLGLVRKIAWPVTGHVRSAIEVGVLVRSVTAPRLEGPRKLEARGGRG